MNRRLVLSSYFLLSSACVYRSFDTGDGSAAEARIGPAGGSVTTSDGVRVDIPAGALVEDKVITIRPSSATVGDAVGAPYLFGPEGQTFAKPITITLPFAGADPEVDLVVYTSPGESDAFELLPARRVDDGHVAVQTTHFSTYVAGTSAPATLSPDLAVAGSVIWKQSDPGLTLNYPTDVAVDASGVVWLDEGVNGVAGGRVMSVSLEAGTAPVVLAQGQQDPKRIASDGTAVYWSDAGNGSRTGAIRKVARTGGTVVTLASGLAFPKELVVSGGRVYWVDADEGAVYSVATTGGSKKLLISGQPGARAIALDATSVYLAAGNNIVKAPRAGGTQQTVTTGTLVVQDLVTDGTSLYWLRGSEVVKCAIAACTPAVLAGRQSIPTALQLDGSTLFWTDVGSGKVSYLPTTGGTVAVRATNQRIPLAITSDATYLYWVDNGNVPFDGNVSRMKKP